LFAQALELTPGDKNALVSRSRCRLLLGDTKGALDDAEEALSNDKQCVKGNSTPSDTLGPFGWWNVDVTLAIDRPSYRFRRAWAYKQQAAGNF